MPLPSLSSPARPLIKFAAFRNPDSAWASAFSVSAFASAMLGLTVRSYCLRTISTSAGVRPLKNPGVLNVKFSLPKL